MPQTNISESQLQPEPLSESTETFSSIPRDSLSAQLLPKSLLSIISTPPQQQFLSTPNTLSRSRLPPRPFLFLLSVLKPTPGLRPPSIQALQSTEELLNTIRLRGSLQLILFPPVRWRSLMIQEFFHGWICQALRLRQVL